MSAPAIAYPDIHKWYTEDRVATEEAVWTEGQHYLENARRIQRVCDEHLLTSVAEFGCGTGWIPTVLPMDLSYAGYDANRFMIERARKKSPLTMFILHDIRIPTTVAPDLACSFAVLKHFSLDDWPGILRNILRNARFGLFNHHCLPNGIAPFDAGTEWHSSWPCEDDINRAVLSAGHQIIDRDDTHIDPIVGHPESYFVTQRRSDV